MPPITSSGQWRRQPWDTGARAPLDFQQFLVLFGVNLTANYLVCESRHMSSTYNLQLISTALVTKLLVIKQLQHPALKSAMSAP